MAWSVASICRQQEGRSQAGKQQRNRVSEMPFQNISFLFLPREKKLAELKQQVVSLKSSIAKEEEKVADLKLKVHLFSSGEYKADDQVHPEIKARGVTMHSSLSAISVLGKKPTVGCTGEGSALLLSNGTIARAGLGHCWGSKVEQIHLFHAAATR